MNNNIDTTVGVFASGFAKIGSYAWLLIPFAIIIGIGLMIFIIKTIKKKKTQWTHKLKVRRALPDGRLTEPVYFNMRRFPLIQKANVFELEKSVLGSYLMPELEEYSGENEFSIILDKSNRIYTNKGEFFCKDKSSVNVSAKHSEIDIERENLRRDFQNINKISKRVEWATIAKYAFFSILAIVVMVLAIVWIQNWSEAQKYKSEESRTMAEAMVSLKEAMETVEATVNTQQLLIPELKELKGTNNLQSLIREMKNETS